MLYTDTRTALASTVKDPNQPPARKAAANLKRKRYMTPARCARSMRLEGIKFLTRRRIVGLPVLLLLAFQTSAVAAAVERAVIFYSPG